VNTAYCCVPLQQCYIVKELITFLYYDILILVTKHEHTLIMQVYTTLLGDAENIFILRA